MLLEGAPAERAAPFLLQFAGPFRVAEVADPHGVVLVDLVRGEELFGGRRVAASWCVLSGFQRIFPRSTPCSCLRVGESSWQQIGLCWMKAAGGAQQSWES